MPIRPENRGRYPPDWKQIRDHIAHERAGGRCECRGECGRGAHVGRCPERDRQESVLGRPGLRIFLTVAHLDHQPENSRPENLRAMCQGCHLHYDIEHHQQTIRERVERERLAAGQLPLAPEGWGLATGSDTEGGVSRQHRPTGPKRWRPQRSLLDERLGSAAYGVFAPPSPERMDLERDGVRARVSAVITAEQMAVENVARTRKQVRATACAAHDAGAHVTQLAVAFAVSRPTIYAWLNERRQRGPSDV